MNPFFQDKHDMTADALCLSPYDLQGYNAPVQQNAPRKLINGAIVLFNSLKGITL